MFGLERNDTLKARTKEKWLWNKTAVKWIFIIQPLHSVLEYGKGCKLWFLSQDNGISEIWSINHGATHHTLNLTLPKEGEKKANPVIGYESLNLYITPQRGSFWDGVDLNANQQKQTHKTLERDNETHGKGPNIPNVSNIQQLYVLYIRLYLATICSINNWNDCCTAVLRHHVTPCQTIALIFFPSQWTLVNHFGILIILIQFEFIWSKRQDFNLLINSKIKE